MSDLKNRLLRALEQGENGPIQPARLFARMGLKRREYARAERMLEQLRKSGKVTSTDGRVAPARHTDAKRATVVKAKRTFGFARLDDGQTEVFLPGKRMRGALPGDRVLLRVEKDGAGLDVGEVLSVTERAPARLSGTVEKEGDDRFLRFDDGAYFPVALSKGGVRAKEGDKVVARILHADDGRDHLAEVQMSYGSALLAKNCCDAILDAAGIATSFSFEVLGAADAAAQMLPGPQTDKDRLDLRDSCIFTIDGADTKDIDDAISLSCSEAGWELGVHIADVSAYVEAGSLLDAEAFLRGTSVYYADSVVPMLPPSLSNGACSLNPDEDRFAFSALMRLSPDGVLTDFAFRKTVIRSRVKGVYEEINRIFSGEADEEIRRKYAGCAQSLETMRELAALLGRRREARGALALTSVESKILIGEDGRAADVRPRVQGEAERLIEELMLTANEAAATLALRSGLPFVFRVHEEPSLEKLAALKELLDAVGIPSGAAAPGVTPKKLSKILAAAQATQYGTVVNLAVLRAMQKARYDARNLGHFGLALANYTHFTSPIRRYCDLTIHRILSAYVAGEAPETLNKRFSASAEAAAKRASMTELRAMDAERACEDRYKAEYIRAHLGERFAGTVVSAAPHGVYVQLDNTVEGLVRTELLGEGMLFDGRMQYATADGKKRLRVGDRVQVTAAAADVSLGRVDFALDEQTPFENTAQK